MEELETAYFAKIATDFDGCDKLRLKLLNMLADRMIADPAGSMAAELHVKWWRFCYYKPIEHYRKIFRSKNEANRIALPRLVQLIDEGLGIILGMMRTLGDRYELPLQKTLFSALDLPTANTSTRIITPNSAATRLLAHLLVCMGDLARYKCQCNPAFQSHDRLALARLCYSIAARAQPSLGHPCNMLAVVASQNGKPLETIYWYVRSLACSEPAPLGKDNLKTYLRSGMWDKRAKWQLDQLVCLIQYHMFAGIAQPSLVSYAEIRSEDRLLVALILIGIDSLKQLDLALWFPQAGDMSSPHDQLVALLANAFGVTSIRLPSIPVHEQISEVIAEWVGFSPVECLLEDLNRGLARAARLDDLLQPTTPSVQSSSDMEEEEIIHFKGFNHS